MMGNRLHVAVSGLALVLLAGCLGEAEAATQHNSTYVRCGNKGPFYGRTDALCHDATTYAPLIEVNGTPERAISSSPVVSLFEDFVGNFTIPDVDSADGAQPGWVRQDAGSQATCGTKVADYDDGAVILLIDNGSEVGDCTVYLGDEQNIDSDKEPVCIFRVQVSDATAAADTVSWGLMGARNALIESTANNAMFMVNGADYGLDVSSDDTSTDTGVDTTGVTLSADTYYEFMVSLNAIHGASPTNVKFFYRSALSGDWTALNTSTTYSIGADTAIQPFLQAEKTSGTTTPGIQADYVSCWWERS
jgi:hypothetical protein